MPNVDPQTFSQSLLAGARDTSGFAISTTIFGVLFGIAAVGNGNNAVDTVLMSALVFTASAQFAALSFWQETVPFAAIALSTFLISSRSILLGLSLAPNLSLPNWRQRLLCMFFITDPNTILLIRNKANYSRTGYFLGGGFVLYITWIVGSAAGAVFTDLLAGSYTRSLGFAGPLVLSTMMVLMAKGNTAQWKAWLSAGLVALLLTALSFPAFSIMPLSVTAGIVVCLHDRRNSRAK